MGKRVDFSARSVISPDPYLDLDELGVPERIARQMTIPEVVNEWNYDRLKKLCEEGKVKHIIRKSTDGRRVEEVINFSRVYREQT